MAVRKGNRAMNVGNEESGIGSQRHRAPIMLALVALIGTVLLVIACQSPLFGTSDPFTEADLVGVWQAEYENIWAYDSQIGQVVDILGTETLTLRSDETYTQVFDDHAGNVRTADGKSWYLDETNIIHLEGGMWPQLGPELSAMFEKQRLGGVQTFNGRDLQLDAGEAYLWVNSLGDGVLEIYHLPTGDHSQKVVRFHKVQVQP